jgi:two-component system cell cycle sensor histidine kinase/response regulator CckA
MTIPVKRIFTSLPLQMVAPVVVAICLVGMGLYFFVLRSVSEFADEQIEEALTNIASEVYDICDSNFTELMQTGKMDDRKAGIIKKAITLGAIEEYIKRNNIGCRLTMDAKGELLRHKIKPALMDFIIEHHQKGLASQVRFEDNTYYFQHFTFKPWGWHVDLVKDTKAYAPLVARVKLAYIVTGHLLFLGLVIILFAQDRFLRRPLDRIIYAIKMGRSPNYRGIHELEFLSDNISKIMLSLEERNKWIHYLYRIAITHRGKDFFNRVADALSETLGTNTMIVRYRQTENRIDSIAFSRSSKYKNKLPDPSSGLPCMQIVTEKRPMIITSGAYRRFPVASCLTEINAESYAGFPIFDRQESITGIMNVFGEKKELDEWDLSLIETVCQLVAVEFEYLVKESDKLKLENQLQQSKKMEAIGLLAGGVAHDLNNVLSGIVSYPDLLLMDLPQDSPLRQPILTIQRSGQKAAEIVQDLLTLARRGVENRSILNLNDVVLEYLLSPEHKKLTTYHSNVSVETHLDAHLLNSEGSSTQLIKMIMNLVSNAAEAQPSGGEITISTRNQRVDAPINGYEKIAEGHFVVLEIKDNGIGIAGEDLARIFEPFYTKKVMGRSGTGLGMAVVWGTIHDHNGYLDMESTEGVGTTFSIFLPVSMEEKMKQKSIVPIDNYLGQKETVLVIDDSSGQRDLAATILRKLNYSVTTASSGEDAVEYMKNNTADLLILDMLMAPGIDGLETYKKILELHPNQKAIITSGYSETELVNEAQRLGAGEYIKKPYVLEKIGLAVKEELAK